MTALGTPMRLELAALALSGIATQLLAVLVGGASLGSMTVWTALALAGGMTLLRGRLCRSASSEVRFFAVSLIMFAFLMLGLRAGGVATQTSGDVGFLGQCIAAGIVFPRWLIGSALASTAFSAIASNPMIREVFSPAVVADGLVRVGGAVVMVTAGSILLRREGPRLRVLLPILSPMWLLFASGYDEYYPLVAWVPVAIAIFLLLPPHSRGRRSPVPTGITAAALPLAYVGFVPLAIVALATRIVGRPREVIRLLGLTAISGFILIRLFWPMPPQQFFPALYSTLNFGETNTGFESYRGHAAGPTSVFFEAGYVFSRQHLQDVAYMTLFGGGVAAYAMLGLAVAGWRRNVTRDDLRSPELWLAGVLVAITILYLLLMIPKLGPHQDVDLFFWGHLVVACFAGHLVDGLADRDPARFQNLRPVAIGSALGSASVALSYLAISGLP